jgi:hypothetical protein
MKRPLSRSNSVLHGVLQQPTKKTKPIKTKRPRFDTLVARLSLDEIVARATRELWTCGDPDTVQRANNAIIRGACLAAVESAFKAWEKGGDLSAWKMPANN